MSDFPKIFIPNYCSCGCSEEAIDVLREAGYRTVTTNLSSGTVACTSDGRIVNAHQTREYLTAQGFTEVPRHKILGVK